MNWNKFEVIMPIPVHRTGWRGVYDALRSAVTGKERLSVNKPFRLTFYSTLQGGVFVNGAKAEVVRE